MSVALAGLALAVIAGAVVAGSSREARAGLIGLVVALALGPFLADPLPGPAALGGRVVSGILVAYLLRAVAGREVGRGLASRLGWAAESILALGAFIAGMAIAGWLAALEPGGTGSRVTDPLGALTPSALALAAGLATSVTGIAPALLARAPLRTTTGLLLLVQGVVLARTGVAGPPADLEQLAIAGFLLAVGAAGALLVVAAGREDRQAAMPAER